MREKVRKVNAVIEPLSVLEGAGVRLRRSFPTTTLDYLDPFLLFDDFSSTDPNDFIRGFPMHPHRGIETVTYVLAGEVNHRDSIGNAGSIGTGDVQWMTSGRGIMHEEMPTSVNGTLTGFQLWVNLPEKHKMTTPRYQEIASQNIPEVVQKGEVRIRVIAGEVDGVRGPVTEIFADPTYLDVSMPPGGSFIHSMEKGHTVFAYVFEGEGNFGGTGENGGETIRHPRLVVFDDGVSVCITAKEQSLRFLLVSGKPLHEPIARYGPFVMNTREEIEQALRDLRNGTFIDPQPNSDANNWYGA